MMFGPGAVQAELDAHLSFQFPLGIRWCSDPDMIICDESQRINFNSPWELDGVRTLVGATLQATGTSFQFPLGIRWCSDYNTADRTGVGTGISIPPGN